MGQIWCKLHKYRRPERFIAASPEPTGRNGDTTAVTGAVPWGRRDLDPPSPQKAGEITEIWYLIPRGYARLARPRLQNHTTHA